MRASRGQICFPSRAIRGQDGGVSRSGSCASTAAVLLVSVVVCMSVTVFWWTRTRARANKQTHTLTSVRVPRRYGNHSALYRMQQDGQRLQDFKPVFYVYDSYHTSPAEWSTVLGRHGAKSIRGGKYDCIVLGLWVEAHHGEDLRVGGFDGM